MLNDRGEVDRTEPQRQFVLPDPADVKEVLDQSRELTDLPVHHVERLYSKLRIVRALDQLQGVAYRRERIPHLVREGGDELRLSPVRLLQRARRNLRALPRLQDLLLVESSIGRVEERNAVEHDATVGPANLACACYDRANAIIGASDLERDLVDGSSHLQQRRVVLLIINFRSNREERLETALANDFFRSDADPVEERGVPTHNRAVRPSREICARRMLVQIAVVTLRPLDIVTAGCRHGNRRRKSFTAAVVSAGALKFGQWPVAFS